ncbi:MAG: UDP-N-acetylmuramate--L-alanine ligase [Chloroflexota bacterium]
MTRTAATIGAGLAPARPARALRPGERIHVVGAAGAGASAAALLARHAGAVPDGCDAGGPSPYTPALEELGIALAWEHDPGHVTRRPGPERLAVTKALTAVAPDHPELVAARERGIPLEPWQQVVADAAVGRRLVAVAGTHGKSTTAGWLVHLLAAAGADPAAFVGALLPGTITGRSPATARWGRGATFVVEADEYAGNFDPYHPTLAVVTNLDWDHPDVFADLDAVIAAFRTWLSTAARHGGGEPTLVANVADPGVERLLDGLGDWPGQIVAVALVDQAPGRLAGYVRGIADQFARAGRPARVLLGRPLASTPEGTGLELHGLDPLAGPLMVRLPTAGRHNAANALCVAAAAERLGLSPAAIGAGLASFPGIGRRLERRGEARGVTVYDDYGHHPTAIRETIAAVRQREPGRRVWAVYEPLTYHRTAALLDGFAEALAAGDAVAVAEIWPGRDRDTSISSAEALAEAVAGRRPEIPIAAPGSVEATAAWLAGQVRPGDVVLVMGGGRSYRIAGLLLEALEQRR